jgi:hypothetical protein
MISYDTSHEQQAQILLQINYPHKNIITIRRRGMKTRYKRIPDRSEEWGDMHLAFASTVILSFGCRQAHDTSVSGYAAFWTAGGAD